MEVNSGQGRGNRRGARHHDDRLPIDPDLAPDDPGAPSKTHTPAAHVPRARQVDVLAAVFAGGFAGALARYELGLAWRTGAGRFPWTTFTINLSGAFLLGLVLTVLLERMGPTRYLRAFLCVGVLGAWTTMSTFSVEGTQLVRDGHAPTALVYAAATVVAGITLTWVGVTLARRLDRRPAR
ncbi:MAG: CrcB family protein [Acidimicrobiales bacterium]|nr:CrcB family protein [Acidimicrobiales bacterium]